MMAAFARLRRLRAPLVVLVASLALTNCRLDELLTPAELGTLNIEPLELVDSARVGSTAPRSTVVQLSVLGPSSSLKFSVTSELSSPWISAGLGVGTAPNDLTISFNPTGLAVGSYSDTLRFSNDGPNARLIRVPVTFTILPCAVTALGALPATTSSALTAEDCAATGQTDRFAKRFRFTGAANDSVSVRVAPSAFASRVTLRRAGVSETLATSETCQAFGSGSCVRYLRLPVSGTYEVEVTSTTAGVTGSFDLSVTLPRNPGAPTALSQRAATDLTQVIAPGTVLATDRIALQAGLSDPDADSLRLELELRPVGTAFSNAATSTTAPVVAGTVAATITGLTDNVNYRWQARSVDQTGRASAWVAFGGGSTDFGVGVPEAPNVPTLLVQRRSDGVTPIATGGTTNEPLVRLGATISDPDPNDQIRLEFEVRPLGTPFNGTATQSSAPLPSGTAVLTSVAGLVDNGQYRWQARAVDQSGRTSAWVSLGGTGAHFRTSLPPAAVAFVQQPSNAAAGVAITPAVRVAVQDASGNTLASYAGPVSVALTNGAGATLGGTTTINAVSGVATFTDLSVDRAGSGYALSASVGLLQSTSNTFNVSSSAADRMQLGAAPTTATAGVALAPAITVTVLDALGNVATGYSGNVTLALAPNDSGAVLLGTTTIAAVNGVATFSNVRIERAASGLRIVATASGLASVQSAAITVTAAAPQSLVLVTAPSTAAQSGVALAVQPVLELRDAFANPVRSSGTSVRATLASGPVGATLSGDEAFTDAEGRATFTSLAIVGPAGNYSLTFTSGSFSTPTTAAISIGAGAATQLALITAPPATAVNGEAFSTAPVVRLRDVAGNNVSESGIAVSVSIASGGGALLGTTTVLTNASGIATFSDVGIVGTIGTRTLSFSAPSLTGLTSGSVNVVAGAATTLELNAGDGQSAAAATDVAIAPSVVVRDVSGNAVAGVAVQFAVTAGGGSIAPTTAVTTDANGIASLTRWTLGPIAGGNSLSASADGLDGSPLVFTATATAGVASVLSITGGDNLSGPVGTTLGTAHEVRVTDATGNPVAGVTVNWNAVGGGSVNPIASATDVDGRASTTRTLGPTAGTQSTVASVSFAGGLSTVTFNVTATVGGATQLQLVAGDAQVDTVGATLPIPLSVRVRDALNNPVQGVLITWNVLAGGGSVGSPTSVSDVNGLATTTWRLGTTRTATDSTQIARASGVGSPVTFVALARPGAVSPALTQVSVAPASIAASRTTPATVTVTARDGFGNPVAGVPVTLSATGTGNTITQPAAVTNANGIATGAIGAAVTGARSITATVNGIVANTTPTLTVVAAPPAALLFTTTPTLGVAGADLDPAPAVGVLDSLGNRNLAFTGSVTLALGSNPSAGTLSGSLTRTAVAGVATFPGIAINKTGIGYRLAASSSGLTSATSSAFTITSAGVSAARSLISASPATITAGGAASTISVTARDANDNPVAGATVVLSATGTGNTLQQPALVTDANGVATGTLASTAVGTRTVSASIDGTPITATTNVNVVAGTVSPTTSTITGVPTTLVAGIETSAVTVIARDAFGNPVPGASVVIAATGSNNTIIQPAATTNASGVATGSFGSTRAESKVLSATINGVALSQSVDLSVLPGAISAARSLLVAAPTSLVAGAGSSTITVTARDANDNPISGASVTLAATGAGNTLTQPAAPTNASGVVTGSLASTASGAKVVTATIGGIAITQSATVTFQAGGVSATLSTIETDAGSFVAGDSTTVTVTARDANGNPVVGAAVVLSATGDGNTLTQPAATTDANGVATGRLASTVAQDKTITATVAGVALTQSATVSVSAGAISDTASTVVVAPTTIAADGSSASITVTVRDAYGNAISGASVVLAATGSGNTLTQPTSVTDANGVASGSISAVNAGIKTISATADAIALADSIALTVTAAGISGTQSSVSVAPTSITAGSGSATITVVARDGNGNPVPGATVVLSSTGSGNTLTQPAAVTDANGVATGSIASTVASTKSISASINGTAVSTPASLVVTPAAISPTTSTVAVSSGTISAGTGSTTVTVTVRDAFGNAVPGRTVVLSATGDGNTLTQPAAVTNASGVATGTFRSSTSEAKTISATADGIAITATAAVTVVPDAASPSTSTVSISTNSLVAGSDTATVTVTARDGSGNVVPGVAVALASADADLILIQPVANTDANGVATGRVVGTLVGSKTISATLNGVAANATVSVTVTAAAVSADSSTISASPSSFSAGSAGTTITVVARDAFGNLISGRSVVLSATGSNNTLTQPATTTNGSGATSGTLTSTATGTKIVSATIDGAAITSTASVTVTTAALSASQSTVAVSAASITAGGAASTITVTARDLFGNPIAGATVTLSATGSSNTLTQPAAVTNASGVATGTIASTLAGARTISASINGTAVTQTQLVTVVAGNVSASQSTIGADPASIVAGVGTSTITVRARDAFGNSVAGATVLLIASGSSNTVGQPAGTTDVDGVATGTLTSTVAESKNLQAIVNGVTLASGATVTVTPGAVSPTLSTIAAAPTTLTAGAGSSTITVTARDANNNLISGASVVLAATGSGNTLTQPAALTASTGVATGALSSTGAGTKTVTATVNGVALSGSATVTVAAAAISAAQSTISLAPSTVTAGGAAATATVTVRDAFDNPIAGASVVLATTASGATITQPSATTDANGVATGTIAATIVTPTTVTATANAVALTQTATLTVQPGAVSAAQSSVVASAASIVAGSGSSTITVTARDASGNAVPNASVSLAVSGSGAAFDQATGTTDANGVFTAVLSGTVAGLRTVTATINSTVVTQTASVSITAAALSAARSLVVANPTSLIAQQDTSSITVTARDAFDNPIAGVSVSLAASGTGNSIVQPVGVTDGNGSISGRFSSTVTGSKTITATAGSVALDQQPTITVSAAAVSAAQSTVSASPASIVAGTTDSTTVTVTARDAFGNAIAGATVTLGVTGGTGNTVVQPSGVTDAAGVAVGYVRSTGAGTKTITATINGTAATQTASVSVTAASVSAATSTISVASSTISAGVGSTNVTVTARDAFNNPIAGASVVIAATGGDNTITQPGLTATNGTAVGAFSSSLSESKTLSATINGVSITQTATVNVVPDAVSTSQSEIAADPLTIVAGSGTSSITVTARDSNGNPVPGVSVTLESASGDVTFTQPAANTDTNGVTTGSVSGTIVGSKTIRARLNGVLAVATVNVSVTPAAVDAALSSLTASSTAIVAGGAGSVLTLTARDAFGNVIPNASVLFAATGAGTSLSATSATTDANGVATTTLTGNTSTSSNVSATVAGTAITQTQSISIAAAAASAARSLISVSPSSITTDGSATITVQLRDAFDNLVSTSGGSVVLATTLGAIGTVTDNTNGTYTATFTSGTLGSATITGTLAGSAIGDDASVAVTIGAASTATTQISASPSSISTDGSATITVQLRDAAGNAFTTGAGTVVLSTTLGTLSTVTDNGNGTYSATLTSSGTGTATITGTLNGNAIADNAVVTVGVGGASVSTSQISSNVGSITTDGAAIVTVQLRDAAGNNLTSGGGTVVLSTTLGALSAVTNNGNGSYTATFTSSALGTATITGTLNGTPIVDDASVTVSVGAASLATSLITASTNAITTDGSATITVQLRDAAGNNLVASAGTVTLATTLGTVGSVTNNANGSYTATLTSGALGTATISGTLNGSALADTAGVSVSIGSPSANTSTISASPSSISTDGSATITVQLRDAANNAYTTGGASITLATTLGALTAVTDNGNGSYTASLSSSTTGTATITGSIGATPIVDNAVVIVGVGGASVAQSTITPSATGITTDESANIAVQLKDANGNNLASSGGTVLLSTTLGSLTAVTDNGDGTYSATLTSTVPGTATITGTLNGTPIVDNAIVGISVGAASTATTQITTAAASITVDGSTTITVQLRDAAGNNLASGPVTVALATSLGSVGSVTNNANGSYSATLTSTVPGTATITGTINGSPISDNAVVSIGVGAVTAAQSSVEISPASITAGGTGTTVTVTARDQFGNAVPGAAVVIAASGTGNSVTQPSATTNASGIATGTVTSTVAGTKTISAAAASVAISQTQSLTVVAGTVSAGNSSLSAGTASIVAGSGTSLITVTARDANNNPVPNAAVVFAATGSNNSFTSASGNTDVNGVATVVFSSTTAEAKTISATVAGVGVTQTAAVTVIAGAATQMSLNAGDGQSAVAGQQVAIAPSVLVRDANNNPVSGVSVTFAVTAGGGSITGGSATTNASGIATVGSWTLGAAAGSNTLTATSGTLTGSPVTFTATGTAGGATQITASAGDGQSAIAGQAVAISPAVLVRDANNNPVAGVSVTFAVASGGGSITGASATTNSSGIATVGTWTLGTTAGSNTLTATSGSLTGSPVTFTATGTAGAATQMTVSAGDAQSAVAGQAVAVAPAVLVRDANNNPVSGVSVTFAVATGGGSITGGSATTNASGIASVGSWTLGATAGANTLTATSGSLTGSPITFTATGTTGAATQIAINAGNGQTATAGSAVAIAPSVLVRDTNNNPVAGVSVTFTVATGGGSITGGSATTNASGIATIGSWTLGNTAGSNTLTATSGTLSGSPITFTATGVAGAATQIAVSAGNTQSATVNTAVAIAPSVVVSDVFGNPVSGVSVSFAVGSGGGSITGASATTNASGIASVGSWTLGTVAGGNTLTATSGSLTGSPVTFTATGTAGAATQMSLNAGNTQTATVGNAVATAPSVLVRDVFNNPVAGVSVTFAVTAGGGSVTGGDAITNASGIATVGSWTLGTTAGANSLTATSTGLTGSPVTFTATGTASSATQISISAGDGQTAVAGAAVAIAPAVLVRDANNNPVAGVTVTFSVATGGGGITGGSATTNASGIASVGSWTLGTTVGSNTLTATSGGLTGSPITFTATGIAGAATQISVSAGDGQTAVAGQAVAIAPAVLVRDANNNPVSGVSVTFSVASGGGNITGANATTNASGIATVGSWTLGTTAGSNSLAAASGTLSGSPVTFTATGVAGAATQMSISAGDAQSAVAGQAVAVAPAVLVRDANGNSVADVSVTFAVASGGGSITGANATTNASGIATVGSWTLGATAGSNSLTATSNGLTGSPITFTATGTAGAAAQISINAGNAQSAVAGQTVAIAPSVLVRDANNNAVAGVSVTFAVASGGGNITGGAATTNASGIATVGSWTLGNTAGANSMTAASTGLTGSPVTFTATGTAGAATQISISAGDGQSAVAGQSVAVAPAVLVRDINGNPVADVSVTFAVSSGGGNITGANATTNASGIATVGSWTLGTTAGSNTMTATSGSLAGSPVTFTATGVAGAATQITISAGDAQSAAAGQAVAVAPAVLVRDANNNPVSGVSVTFAVASGGGSVTGENAITNASGIATIGSWTLGTTAGANSLTATSTGLTGSPITFTATGTAGAATQISINAGNAQTAIAGQAVSVAPSVLVRDANNNPVSGVSVTFAVATGNGSVTGESATTNASGIATVGSWTLGATAGANSLTATSTGLTGSPVTFTATGTAGAATQIAISAGNNQTAVAGSAVATAPSVVVRDVNNNPVAGVSVTFAVASGNGSVTGENATTNASGIATVQSWTLGTTAGANSLTATSTGLTGSPLTFTATGTAGAATQMSISGGNAQSAVAGEAVAVAPAVLVRDANNNPVSGVSVTFAVASGGGSVTGENATTNASGIATIGSWTLGTTAGANSLTATSTGLTGSPITFTATGTAGAATQISVSAGNGQSAVAGQAVAVAPAVLVRDANNNPVSGVSVTFAVASGNGSITGENATTNSSGIATIGSWTLGTTAGANSLTATSTGLTGSPITFTATGTAGAATQISISAGNAQSAVAGQAVAVAPAVVVRDINNNPVSGVSVTFAVASGGGSITGENATTNPSGIATIGSWTLGATAGANSLTATSTGLTGSPITFSATGTVGAASTATTLITVNDNSITTDESATITVQLRDANNNNLTVSGGTIALNTTIGSITGLTDNANGTYTATFSSTSLGTATISGTLNSNAITDTENVSVTVGAPSPDSSTIAATSENITADETATVTLTLRDAAGNAYTASAGDIVGFSASPGGTFGTVTDNGNGTYSAVFTPTFSGVMSVSSTVNSFGSASLNIVVSPGAASPNTSEITVNNANITSDGISTITVRLRDAQGNNLSTAGGTVTLSTDIGSITGLAYFNNGAWRATFDGGAVGTATITGKINGADIVDNATVNVSVGAVSAATSTVTSSASTVTASTGSETVTIIATARDAAGNTISGATVVFGSTGTDNAFLESSGLTGVGGDFQTTFSSTKAEPKTISATINDVLITQTASVTVEAAAPDSINLVDGDGQDIAVGNPYPIAPTVRVSDAFGNPVPNVTVTWTVISGGSIEKPISLTNAAGLADGGAWTPGTIGNNQVNASVGFINGSPVIFIGTAF